MKYNISVAFVAETSLRLNSVRCRLRRRSHVCRVGRRPSTTSFCALLSYNWRGR